ncbi:hypothetical protein BJP34_26060 [Moorena producens PAL-8-15-08-1]|uniref:Uncharacterized protein n=1 Tax=Moorena producens PAL-8-15-08-1 TaxID=1458985 RepID=A0A1D8TXP4_9CYAN|nr:hypothetical protein BJP34_26060 [Moorena producens PAL-8-15-08-1]
MWVIWVFKKTIAFSQGVMWVIWVFKKTIAFSQFLGWCVTGRLQARRGRTSTKPAPNTPYATITSLWVVRYGAASGAKRQNMKPCPPLTHPTQLSLGVI